MCCAIFTLMSRCFQIRALCEWKLYEGHWLTCSTRTLAALQGYIFVGSSSDLKFIFAVRCEDNIQKDVMEICCEMKGGWKSSWLWPAVGYVLNLGFYHYVVLSQNCIVPSPRKIMVVSHGIGNPACCMCEFSRLKVRLNCDTCIVHY